MEVLPLNFTLVLKLITMEIHEKIQQLIQFTRVALHCWEQNRTYDLDNFDWLNSGKIF